MRRRLNRNRFLDYLLIRVVKHVRSLEQDIVHIPVSLCAMPVRVLLVMLWDPRHLVSADKRRVPEDVLIRITNLDGVVGRSVGSYFLAVSTLVRRNVMKVYVAHVMS